MLFEGTTLFKGEWKPEIGDNFQTMIKEVNDYDKYTEAVYVERNTFGQMP